MILFLKYTFQKIVKILTYYFYAITQIILEYQHV